MAASRSLRVRVEAALKQVLGIKTLVKAPNGSWPLRRGSTTFWVDVLESSRPLIVITLAGVRASAQHLKADG